MGEPRPRTADTRTDRTAPGTLPRGAVRPRLRDLPPSTGDGPALRDPDGVQQGRDPLDPHKPGIERQDPLDPEHSI